MKAFWSFEPFHPDKGAIRGMHQLLKQFTQSNTGIEVGYVVTRTENELATAFDIPYEKRFSSYPKELILNALKGAGVSLPKENVHIIDHQTFSTTEAVDGLLAKAKSEKCDLICLYTHGNKGLKRFILGSFAETAIHRSKVNLLVASPKSKFSPKLKNILFASDFGPTSKKQLSSVVQLCQQTKARLTIFHAAQPIYEWSLDEESPHVISYRKKVNTTKAEMEKACDTAGIDCTVLIRSEFRSPTELALSAAKKSKAELIVVGAKTGPIAALMGGSVTRQIVRNGELPVWVLKD